MTPVSTAPSPPPSQFAACTSWFTRPRFDRDKGQNFLNWIFHYSPGFSLQFTPDFRLEQQSPKGQKIEKDQSRLNFSILTLRIPHQNRGFVGGSLEIFNLLSIATRRAATRICFSQPAGFDLGLRNRGHLRLLRE